MDFQIYASNGNIEQNFKWNWKHVKRERDNRLDVSVNFIGKLEMSSSRSLVLIDSGGNTDYAVEEMEFRVLFNVRKMYRESCWTKINDAAPTLQGARWRSKLLDLLPCDKQFMR